ncbi:MAG: DUF1036 domain-containing protein [Bdellovibrionales bacterium]|nr:DUF1036 domain-containing protein [Bdellovibrionales bacterium]
MKFLIALSMLLSVTVLHAQSVVSTLNGNQLTQNDSPPVPGPARIRLFLQNNCYIDVMTAIRVQNSRGQMESRGFYRLFPGQRAYVADVSSADFLLYGVSSDNRFVWSGPYTLPLGANRYPAMLIRLPGDSGDWTTTLYC